MFLCTISDLPDKTESNRPQTKEPSDKKSSTSIKLAERPKVSFGPYIEKQSRVSASQKQKEFPKQTRLAAKGHFTPHPGEITFL